MYPNNYLSKVSNSASRFSNYGGGMENGMSQLNRTLTVVITNATNVASSYILFGYNQYGTEGTQGTGVTVTINESSYNQVLRETGSIPYEFVQAKFNTTSSTNLSYVVSYTVKDATGQILTRTFTPLTYQEPENNNTSLVRIPDFNGVVLDGQTVFTASIAASSTITYILTLKAKSNLANSLAGSSIVTAAGAPAPNGTAPIQLTLANPSFVGVPATQPGVSNGNGMPAKPSDISRFY